MRIANKLILCFASASLGSGAIAPSYAQGTAAQSDVAAIGASSAQPTKAQRKQARKEARAKRAAELRKLEGAGYQPGGGKGPNHPQDVQDAQKKAGVGRGASQ